MAYRLQDTDPTTGKVWNCIYFGEGQPERQLFIDWLSFIGKLQPFVAILQETGWYLRFVSGEAENRQFVSTFNTNILGFYANLAAGNAIELDSFPKWVIPGTTPAPGPTPPAPGPTPPAPGEATGVGIAIGSLFLLPFIFQKKKSKNG